MKLTLKLLFLLSLTSIAELPAMENNPTPADIFELTAKIIRLQIEGLNLRHQLLQRQSEALKLLPSPIPDSELQSFERNLADYWETLLQTNKAFDDLAPSASKWQRAINGEHRDAYRAFSLNLSQKAKEKNELELEEPKRIPPFIGPPDC